jgi:outer membrane protein with beta-barrel domain
MNMKKMVLILLVSIIIVPVSFAQKGAFVGVNGSLLSTNIINQNIWGSSGGFEYDYKITLKGSFGLDVGYNFSEKMGIYTGFWIMNMGQNYTGSQKGIEWERELKFKYNAIPVMFRYYRTSSKIRLIGGVGFVFAMLNEGSQTWTCDGNKYSEIGKTIDNNKDFDLGDEDVTDRFKNDIILNLELGGRKEITENIYLDATLNLGIGLLDINDEDYRFKDPEGNYEASHNFYGGLKVGIAYKIF